MSGYTKLDKKLVGYTKLEKMWLATLNSSYDSIERLIYIIKYTDNMVNTQ